MFRRLVIRSLIGTIVALAVPGGEVVWSHAFPVRSDPRVGSVIRLAPTAVRIWFDENIEPAFSRVTVVDAASRRVDGGDSRVDLGQPRLIEVSLPALPAGTYLVQWAVLSIDGHRTSGDFRFTVKPTD